jgi:acyl carrier protein
MNPIDQRLQAIFRSVFDLSETADVAACSQLNTATWDSMAHVTLVVAIEEEFGFAMDASDSMTITSYDAARRYLAAQSV